MTDSSFNFMVLVIMMMIARLRTDMFPEYKSTPWWLWMACQVVLLILMAWQVYEEFKRIPVEVRNGAHPSTVA